MDLGKGIIIYATEDAKRKWEGLEQPKKTKKKSCPSCELNELIKQGNDYIIKEKG
jgi:hypothetical protein